MKRVHRLLIVAQRLRYRADNGRFGVSTERCLQNASHLAVTIVDESFAITLAQLIDDVGEGEQGPVYVAALAKA